MNTVVISRNTVNIGLNAIRNISQPVIKKGGNIAREVPGNAFGASATFMELSGLALSKIVQGGARLFGFKNYANQVKNAWSPAKRQGYLRSVFQEFGAPKSGEFWTQQAGQAAKKVIDKVNSFFTQLKC